jgi:hypothetical protein
MVVTKRSFLVAAEQGRYAQVLRKKTPRALSPAGGNVFGGEQQTSRRLRALENRTPSNRHPLNTSGPL